MLQFYKKRKYLEKFQIIIFVKTDDKREITTSNPILLQKEKGKSNIISVSIIVLKNTINS